VLSFCAFVFLRFCVELLTKALYVISVREKFIWFSQPRKQFLKHEGLTFILLGFTFNKAAKEKIMLHTHDVRRRFLDYFKNNEHMVIPSSPVVPHDDPTLLFTNAGMNQFKDVFLGKSARDYKRAATSQKCIRVGGKHNDLENVGHTRRHLTFFEMLGNFSFGDYFKEKAIQFAWEVSTEIFAFDKEKIWASVFRDDDEAYELWQKYLPTSRIVRLGEKDNFWAMGETGPCGPCSELLYDRGTSYNTSATSPTDDTTGERFLEFWNLVFMQYNRSNDGKLIALPKPSIDTGAGLERVMSLIQGKENVFETDVLRSIIARVEEISGVAYNPENSQQAAAFRVIADHLRCLAFAMGDGAQPSNVERGYVLRKVLRRAVRYGKVLGFEKPFLADILPRLVEVMGHDYKELIVSQSRIQDIVTQEEEAFFKTLRRGGNILNQIIEDSKAHAKEISGADAFKLKDTYGLPLEEVLLIAKDNDLHVDVASFDLLEKEAKEKSKAAQKVSQQVVEDSLYQDFVNRFGESRFIRDLKADVRGKVLGIIAGGTLVESLLEGQEGMVILDETSFYAEMGGQIGDTGELIQGTTCFSVTNCISPFKGVIAHVGTMTTGALSTNMYVETHIDKTRRQKIQNNHTATHLLHWALHQVLGEHVKQAGSVVDATRLRFDFNHHKALTEDELRALELLINDKIRANSVVDAYELSYEDAQKRHDIKQFFGEKYGKTVRVIDIDFSKELCGGTHTSHTGNIGYFRIQKESSISAGVRRIEAVSGVEAEDIAYSADDTLKALGEQLKVLPTKLLERVEKLIEEMKESEQKLKAMQKGKLDELAKALPCSVSGSGVSYCIYEVQVTPGDLRGLVDTLSVKIPSGVIGLACVDGEKAHLVVKVSQDLVTKGIKAVDLLKAALVHIDGSGGGKADNAQGAGKTIAKLTLALDELKMRLS
jgi:alanyl-tRNA synthetase